MPSDGGVRERILSHLDGGDYVGLAELARLLGVDRSTIDWHVRSLAKSGRIVHGVRLTRPSARPAKAAPSSGSTWGRDIITRTLREEPS